LLDRKVERIAFRRVRIVEEKLVNQEGLTFLFEVNNIRIFCGGGHLFYLLRPEFYRLNLASGSNWIPADSFITR
jgi:beta-mannosidase